MLFAIDKALSPTKHKRRKIDDINYVVVHRTIGATIDESIAEFKKVEKFEAGWYTGGIYPYHFFLPLYGDPVQCLPLTCVAPAALRTLNQQGIHVALAGDFRKQAPGGGQLIKLKHLVTSLNNAFNGDLEIIGHTETPLAHLEGSKDPSKVCPGAYLDLNDVRLYAMLHQSNLCELAPIDGLKRAGYIV